VATAQLDSIGYEDGFVAVLLMSFCLEKHLGDTPYHSILTIEQ
jgi:hypothetical protein